MTIDGCNLWGYREELIGGGRRGWGGWRRRIGWWRGLFLGWGWRRGCHGRRGFLGVLVRSLRTFGGRCRICLGCSGRLKGGKEGLGSCRGGGEVRKFCGVFSKL